MPSKKFSVAVKLLREWLEELEAQSLGKMIDTVEDVTLESEGENDLNRGRYMTLEGDFVFSCVKYLCNENENDPDYNKLKVNFDSFSANKLDEGLGEWGY